MKRELLALIIVVPAGCGNLSGVLDTLGLSATNVTLRLVNETAFRVEPNVFVSGAVGDLFFDELTEELLTLQINRQDFGELSAGEVITRRFDCNTIEAVMASDAELKTGIGLSPDDDTAVFTQGDDFDCGDTITILFTGSLGSFNAQISAAPFDPLALIDLLVTR